MKITKRQLKQFIKESILVEGNHAVEYAVGYEDARDGLPQNSDDPWYAAGFADYLEGIHDQYEALHQDGITTPPPQAGQMEGRKLRKKRLRRIIREAVSPNIDLYLDLGADGDFPTMTDSESEKQWEVPYFTSAADFLDEVLSQLPGSTPDTIVYGEEMDLPDLPLSQVWDAVMAAGRT